MKPMFESMTFCVVLATIGCADGSQAVSNSTHTVLPSAAINPPNQLREEYRDLDWEELAVHAEGRSQFIAALPKHIVDLDGAQVRIRGYYDVASIFTEDGVKHFVLPAEITSDPIPRSEVTLNPIALPLHYLLFVEMRKDSWATFTTRPIEIAGRLSIQPISKDGKIICIYKITADNVTPATARNGFRPAIAQGC